MGYVCRGEVELGKDLATSQTVVQDPIVENQLPNDFYEIEEVFEQRLCHKTLACENRVHFLRLFIGGGHVASSFVL